MDKGKIMITVRPVRTCKEKKQFLEFPNQLYKGNPYFVPPLYMSEKAIFKKNYYYYDECEAEYFSAYDDGKIVGRIGVFIQRASNEKTGEKRARFGRFDAIDDQAVANALFDAAIAWAKARGMEKICGPLGFSDLEREGLLIEGFDVVQTFEEQYNYEYYKTLIENYGFTKDVDWLEYQIRSDRKNDGKVQRVASYLVERTGYHLAEVKNIGELVRIYADDIFNLIDVCYSHLYGTVDISPKMRKELIKQFKLMLETRYVPCVLDENGKLVSFALIFPNIGEAMQVKGGHLTIRALLKLRKIMKDPKILDMGLIAVHPDYQNKGINAFYMKMMSDWLAEGRAEHFETNLCLETNTQVQAQWKYFDARQVKRRRSFVLDIKQ